MRVFVCSDTHGNYLETISALSAAGHVDLIIHLGDEVEDAFMLEHISSTPVLKVAGNCDRCHNEKRERFEEIAGYRLFMTHGDLYHVKSGLGALLTKAMDEHAQIVLFGHTHNALVQEMDGVLLVNPGTMQHRCATKSYALLSLSQGTPSAEIFHYPPAV